MVRSFHTTATGMVAQQIQIDVTSSSISNVDTVGFKKSKAEFTDLMYRTTRYVGTSTSTTTFSPPGIEAGLGVRPTAVTKVFAPGSYKSTSTDSFDMVIEGNGFFQIQLPDGTTAHTKNGQFTRDNESNVVNADGYRLVPGMTVPEGATNIGIAKGDTVSVTLVGGQEETQIRQIELV